MSIILKRARGAAIKCLLNTWILTGVGMGAAFITYAAQGVPRAKLKPFYNYDKVQEIVQDNIDSQLADLDEALANGDISEGEYITMKEKINGDSYRKDLSEEAADEYFADDKEYKGILKQLEQLEIASYSCLGVAGAALLTLPIGWGTGLFEKLEDIADEDFEDDGEEERQKRQQRKKEKIFQKEMEEYSEKVE